MSYITRLIHKIKNIYYRSRFKKFGRKSMLINPKYIMGGENIEIGNRVVIRDFAWLGALPLTGAADCRLVIGDGCVIGHFNELFATNSVIIEDNVLTADRVYISDNLHGYEDVSIPVVKQSIKQIGTVRIGEGTWLGAGVCVIGASVGKHCVVGANAVVTKDIPDYSVAVGIPARVVKRYDFELNAWRKTNAEGVFLND